MKKLICILLCLLALVSLFAGCKSKNTPVATDATLPGFDTPDEPEGVHFRGLNTAGITAEQLAASIGLTSDFVISAQTGSGEELLIINDVLYNTILFKQLQCINYADKSVITLTYFLDDEEMEDALMGIVNTLEPDFGMPNAAEDNSGAAAYTFRAPSINKNYIYLYPLNENEVKLSFYLF